MKTLSLKIDPLTNEEYYEVYLKGQQLFNDPILNKVLCFETKKRTNPNLVGLLRSVVSMMKYSLVFIVYIFLIVAVCSNEDVFSQTKLKEKRMEIKVESSAFKEGEFIPSKFTCDGDNTSPQLKWSNFPKETKSFALINDDPDAPIGDWVHWVVYNIPVEVTELSENQPASKTLSNGAVQGLNDWKKFGYGGPCPPPGIHRYFFKIFALDTILNLNPGATKKQLLDAMKGHILAEGKLMGKYSRKR